jgi:hypothetical protein
MHLARESRGEHQRTPSPTSNGRLIANNLLHLETSGGSSNRRSTGEPRQIRCGPKPMVLRQLLCSLALCCLATSATADGRQMQTVDCTTASAYCPDPSATNYQANPTSCARLESQKRHTASHRASAWACTELRMHRRLSPRRPRAVAHARTILTERACFLSCAFAQANSTLRGSARTPPSSAAATRRPAITSRTPPPAACARTAAATTPLPPTTTYAPPSTLACAAMPR